MHIQWLWIVGQKGRGYFKKNNILLLILAQFLPKKMFALHYRGTRIGTTTHHNIICFQKKYKKNSLWNTPQPHWIKKLTSSWSVFDWLCCAKSTPMGSQMFLSLLMRIQFCHILYDWRKSNIQANSVYACQT